jgi:hypothetical protein
MQLLLFSNYPITKLLNYQLILGVSAVKQTCEN